MYKRKKESNSSYWFKFKLN